MSGVQKEGSYVDGAHGDGMELRAGRETQDVGLVINQASCSSATLCVQSGLL